MSFAYPWALLFPLIIYVPKLFLRPRKTSTIRFPDKQSLLPNRIESWRATLRAPILHSLCLAMLCFLAIAAARPQRVTPLPLPDTARNIMLALDVSGSMKTRDFIVGGQTANRLEAVKYVVSQFVERRKGDRIGLVIFGTESYLECPLTLDHDLVVRLIQNLSVGIAGEGTAIGDGLALGLKRISDVLEKQQDTRTSNRQNSSALILLTDGVNTSGSIDPIQAADVAKDLGVKIHTIGIGSNETANLARRNPFFGDNLQRYEFDEKMLQAIATKSNGFYFNASDLAGLEKVYSEIDALEKKDIESLEKVHVEELYTPFLVIALLCYLVYLALSQAVFMVVP